MADFVSSSNNKATVVFSVLTFVAIVGYIGYTLFRSNVAPDDSAADVVDQTPTVTTVVITNTPEPTDTPAPSATNTPTPTITLTPSPTFLPTITVTPSVTPTPGGIICGNIDVDNNGQLTLVDFNAFSLLYGATCTDTPAATTCGPKDTDDNGKIDIADLYSFTSRYLQPSCAI